MSRKKQKNQKPLSISIYWRLLTYVKPYKWRLTIGILAGFLASGSMFGGIMMLPQLMKGANVNSSETTEQHRQTAAKIVDCAPVKRAKKLLCLTLDDGSGNPRTVASGIAKWYKPEDLIGKTVVCVTNLKPAVLCGVESQGMILSAVDADESLSVVTTTKDVKPGSQVG